jgi:hypothetical protein
MKILLYKAVVETVADKLAEIGIEASSFGYRDSIEIDLNSFKKREITKLRKALAGTEGKRVKSAVHLIDLFVDATNGKVPRARGAKSMQGLVESYIVKNAVGYRLAKKVGGTFYLFFLDRVSFKEKETNRGEYRPASITIHMEYSQAGVRNTHSLCFGNSECRGKTAPQILLRKGFRLVTDEIQSEYEKSVEKFSGYCDKIGMQCVLDGVGFVSSWREETECRHGFSSSIDNVCVNGTRKVLIDLIDDKEGGSANRTLSVGRVECSIDSLCRFNLIKQGKPVSAEDFDADEEVDFHEFEENEHTESELLPVHTIVPVFDLESHRRYSVNTDSLEVYEYDRSLSEKLILPPEHKEIISLLSNTDGTSFSDVVEGKSGGAVILLGGRPGLGKTLSAEVFAETVGRPVYKVQCSQLGIEADSLEENLLRVFGRANRWNAIVLLDEADVYIAERQNDLEKNAIVGVFLNILEYQRTTLFMTTNLPDTVDDAIASRCIARIDYDSPNEKDLKAIWLLLSRQNSVKIDETDLKKIVKEYSSMSGRDVKSTIKLCMARGKKKLTFAEVEKAAKFHPNRRNW